MADATTPQRPDLLQVLGPIIGAEPRDEQKFLAALAERVAAGRYRGWADQVRDVAARDALLACAAREDEIATRVEGLDARAGAVQTSFRSRNPELEKLYASLFEGASLCEQFAIQAAAERVGAATWRAYAAEEKDPRRAEVLASCAPLEEESATLLESLVARGVGEESGAG